MCGCKKNNQNVVESMSRSVMRESAQAQELDTTNKTLIQFVGAGSNITFYGVSGSRYYFTSGLMAYVKNEDAKAFLTFRQGGKSIFVQVKEEEIKKAIEVGEVLQELANPVAEQLPEPEPEVLTVVAEEIEDAALTEIVTKLENEEFVAEAVEEVAVEVKPRRKNKTKENADQL